MDFQPLVQRPWLVQRFLDRAQAVEPEASDSLCKFLENFPEALKLGWSEQARLAPSSGAAVADLRGVLITTAAAEITMKTLLGRDRDGTFLPTSLLDISGHEVNEELLEELREQLLAQAHMCQLQDLRMSHCSLTRGALRLFSTCFPLQAHLRRLDLSHNSSLTFKGQVSRLGFLLRQAPLELLCLQFTEKEVLSQAWHGVDGSSPGTTALVDQDGLRLSKLPGGQLTEAETFPTTHRLPPQPPPQAPADPTPEPAGSGTTAATPLAKGPLSDALRESLCPLSAAITPLPHDPLSDALRACARPLPAAASVATSGHSSGHASTRLHSRIGPGLGHAAQSHARKKARQTLLPMASRSNPASSSHRTASPIDLEAPLVDGASPGQAARSRKRPATDLEREAANLLPFAFDGQKDIHRPGGHFAAPEGFRRRSRPVPGDASSDCLNLLA
ncbi:hypothetical protein WJX84_003058 [Apatococcus fuscideae]|uniref:Leucine-rich repeat-containing protein 42 n=1 Tax=Apatococcus fuscideae TaxID=2026836 RepID=A0AAW1SME3_9CHLO